MRKLLAIAALAIACFLPVLSHAVTCPEDSNGNITFGVQDVQTYICEITNNGYSHTLTHTGMATNLTNILVQNTIPNRVDITATNLSSPYNLGITYNLSAGTIAYNTPTTPKVITTVSGFVPGIVNGSPYNDTLLGDGNANSFNGGNGADTVTGNGGNDVLSGGGGNDVIHGNAGTDVIYGNGGNDTIYGDQGNNNIYAGTGNDTVFIQGTDVVYGEAGSDIHKLLALSISYIADFAVGVDKVYLPYSLLSAVSVFNGVLPASDFSNTGGAKHISYNNTTGVVSYVYCAGQPNCTGPFQTIIMLQPGLALVNTDFVVY